MVSKALVLFVVVSQTSQWIFIAHWLFYYSREDCACSAEKLSVVVKKAAATATDQPPSSTATTDSTSSIRMQSTTTTPNPRSAVRTRVGGDHLSQARPQPTDIDRYLQYHRNQSLERFRSNTFAPTNSDLFYSYLPQIWCPAMVRVGGLNDGGKWMCNPWYLVELNDRRTRNRSNCLVYSIGVGFTLTFDKELIERYACRVYAFDPDPMAKRTVERTMAGAGAGESIRFYPWAVVGSRGGGGGAVPRRSPAHKSIADVLTRFEHRRLDVLKIDVEGGEFDIIEGLLSNDDDKDDNRGPIVPICQLLIEVHTWDVTKWRRMFRRLERARFRMFSREVNILGFGNRLEKIAIEYSYIHEDCLEKFKVSKRPRFENFAPEGYTFEPLAPQPV